jgi:VWFA-related protein
VFRPTTVLVPVNVRVVDARNSPVTDLRQSDFRLFEDDKPQEIAFFEPAVAAASAAVEKRTVSEKGDTKTILIVLGRGRLDGPSHGLSAIDSLINTLNPIDRIGVAAYDRVSDITTDTASVRRLLARFKSHNNRIENVLSEYLTGLTAMHWDGQTIPPKIQEQIDDVFRDSGLPSSRRLPALFGPSDDLFNDYRQMVRDIFDRDQGKIIDKPSVRGHMDTLQLFTCVEYLRRLPGEKQLIYVTEQPPPAKFFGPRLDRLARLAADARVTISTFQVGGIQASFASDGRTRPYEGSSGGSDFQFPNPFPGRTLDESISIETSRSVSAFTGGVFSAYEPASDGFARLANQWAATYVIAYYPQDSGKSRRDFHSISVKVDRPSVKVFARAGYFVTQQEAPTAESTAVEFMRAALDDPRVFEDLAVSASAQSANSGTEVRVVVDCAGLPLQRDGDHWVTTVAIAGAIDSAPGSIVEQHKAQLSVAGQSLSAAQKQHATVTLSLPNGKRGSAIKVVVYDYASNRLGSAVANLR